MSLLILGNPSISSYTLVYPRVFFWDTRGHPSPSTVASATYIDTSSITTTTTITTAAAATPTRAPLMMTSI